MRFPKKIFKSLLGLSLIVSAVYVFWGRRFWSAWRQWRAFRAQREHLEADVKRYRLQVATKRYFIRKLMTDADFRKQTAREQGGYVGDNEYVVYFLEDERLSNRKANGKTF